MKKSINTLFLLFIAGFIIYADQIYAQDRSTASTYNPPDTTFNEIILTNEGIVAIDTLGFEWFYDFDKDQFVHGLTDDEIDQDLLNGNDRFGYDIIPVEERCTELRKVKPFVNSVTIGEDEYVEGNIIAYGRVTIKGWVKGDVKSLNNRVLVSNTGQVDGDIEAPDIIVKDGGIVIGKQIISDASIEFKDITSFSIDGVLIVLSFTLFFIFFGFLITSLMPYKFKHIDDCINENKAKTYAIGFFFLLMMPVVILLVIITIVGIVLVPLVPVIYLMAVIMGLISVGNSIGGAIFMKKEGSQRSIIFQSLVGILSFMAFWFLTAILLSMNQGFAEGIGVLILVIMIIASTYPIFTGIGAAFLTRFGFRPYVKWNKPQVMKDGRPIPAPPPIPKSPPIVTPPADYPDKPENTAEKPHFPDTYKKPPNNL